jgi:anti-sigma factor RsiW
MDPHEDTELSKIVKMQADRHAAPAGLRDQIVASIRQAETPPRQERKFQGWRQWLNMGAAFAMGVLASVTVVHFLNAASTQERLAHEVVSSHVRSLMAAHLADVASSDRHTVKPWFSGKLDFSPPVPDLAQAGFPLVGGRLDYISGRPAAALVYQHRQHIINVFVWPHDARAPTPPDALEAQGFNVIGWEDKKMQFWLVSDLNASDLQAFAAQLRGATVAGSPPAPGKR